MGKVGWALGTVTIAGVAYYVGTKHAGQSFDTARSKSGRKKHQTRINSRNRGWCEWAFPGYNRLFRSTGLWPWNSGLQTASYSNSSKQWPGSDSDAYDDEQIVSAIVGRKADNPDPTKNPITVYLHNPPPDLIATTEKVRIHKVDKGLYDNLMATAKDSARVANFGRFSKNKGVRYRQIKNVGRHVDELKAIDSRQPIPVYLGEADKHRELAQWIKDAKLAKRHGITYPSDVEDLDLGNAADVKDNDTEMTDNHGWMPTLVQTTQTAVRDTARKLLGGGSDSAFTQE
jgi:hypothetical protein